MAKYTETLADWLAAGYSLPQEFDQIDGFADLFTGHFIDREIGFETDDLFNIKLQARAALCVPLYAARITQLNAAITAAQTPAKSETTTFQKGKTTATQWELPLDGGTVENTPPASVATGESLDDVTTRDYSGYTPDEALKNVEFLEREVVNLTNRLLHEFDTLFMVVY